MWTKINDHDICHTWQCPICNAEAEVGPVWYQDNGSRLQCFELLLRSLASVGRISFARYINQMIDFANARSIVVRHRHRPCLHTF